MSKRNIRLASEMQRDLTEIFRKSRDKRISELVSITDVELTTDLSVAKIYVSKFGKDRERKELLEALEKANGYIRTELSKRLKIRTVPELRFYLDDSLEYGAKIEQLLSSLGEE